MYKRAQLKDTPRITSHRIAAQQHYFFLPPLLPSNPGRPLPPFFLSLSPFGFSPSFLFFFASFRLAMFSLRFLALTAAELRRSSFRSDLFIRAEMRTGCNHRETQARRTIPCWILPSACPPAWQPSSDGPRHPELCRLPHAPSLSPISPFPQSAFASPPVVLRAWLSDSADVEALA